MPKYYYMRKFLIITAIVIGFGFNANAQWYFKYMCGIGELQTQGGYATKAECEAAAAAKRGRTCRGSNMYGSTYLVPTNSNGACKGCDLSVPTAATTTLPSSTSTYNRNTYQGADLATRAIYTATDALVTGFVNWLFDGEARRARQMERVQEVQRQREEERQERERIKQEEKRIKQELFLEDVSSTLASLKGYDDEGNYDLGLIFEAKLMSDDEDEVVAFIGKSGTPIYKNPSELIVNTDIQQPVNVQEMMSTIEKERFVAVINNENVTFENVTSNLNAVYDNFSFMDAFGQSKEAFEQSKNALAKITKVLKVLEEENPNNEVVKTLQKHTNNLEEQAKEMEEYFELIDKGAKFVKGGRESLSVVCSEMKDLGDAFFNFTSNIEVAKFYKSIRNHITIEGLYENYIKKLIDNIFGETMKSANSIGTNSQYIPNLKESYKETRSFVYKGTKSYYNSKP